jgi:hypothetical protein
MGQLQPLDLVDFTGGLNVNRTEFNLADNESPAMLNIEIDPRGGIFTRYGWGRYSGEDIVADPGEWDPRIASMAVDEAGGYRVYVANGSTVYECLADGSSSDIGVPVGGSSHLADFAEWGNYVYIAAGLDNQSQKHKSNSAATPLGRAYNNDYTTPTGGNVPQAEHIEAHGGYLFVASVEEVVDINNTGSGVQRSRLRWSHPSQPEDWASNDYIDFEEGGGTITGLMSFRDHLLIFKTDSIWALYGYSSESFQLIKVSRSVGVPTPSAITRSEGAVYFYSASQRGGIFAYDGGSPVSVSQKISRVLESVSSSAYQDVWLGWVGRRLWCSLPFDESGDPAVQSVFVLAPGTGDGAWVRHKPHTGNLVCFVEGSDVGSLPAIAFIDGTAGTATAINLGAINGAYDTILKADQYAAFLTDAEGNMLVEAEAGEPMFLVASEDHAPGAGFDTLYRTRWLHAGWPERRKSFRRPRFALQRQSEDVVVNVATSWDYNDSAPQRTHSVGVDAEGTTFWRAGGASANGGLDWGDGSEWGGSLSGSGLKRSTDPDEHLGGLGVARAVQLEFSTSALTPGKKWGINAMFLKYILRRYTT